MHDRYVKAVRKREKRKVKRRNKRGINRIVHCNK